MGVGKGISLNHSRPKGLVGFGNLSVLLYAEDTSMFGKHQMHVQELLQAIATSGGKAGMDLHYVTRARMASTCTRFQEHSYSQNIAWYTWELQVANLEEFPGS